MIKAHHRQIIVVSCALVLGYTVSTVTAENTEQGVAAVEAGNYDEALRILREKAFSGDTKATYLLGTLYHMGKGVQRDDDEAFRLYLLAAEDGLLEAQYQVGMMYLQGEGVTPNDDEALKWLWSAADRGYPQATETLEYVLYNDFTYGC